MFTVISNFQEKWISDQDYSIYSLQALITIIMCVYLRLIVTIHLKVTKITMIYLFTIKSMIFNRNWQVPTTETVLQVFRQVFAT